MVTGHRAWRVAINCINTRVINCILSEVLPGDISKQDHQTNARYPLLESPKVITLFLAITPLDSFPLTVQEFKALVV